MKILNYCDPLDLFSKLSHDEECCFLYSALKKKYSGSYSIIALFPMGKIKTEFFSDLERQLSKKCATMPYFSDGYFGYISYDVKNEFEILPQEAFEYIKMEKINFICYGLILFFNHTERKLIAYAKDEKYLNQFYKLELNSISDQDISIKSIHSNFTKEAYLSAVRKVKAYIFEGDIFEANLTQKYMGKFENKVNGKKIFHDLMRVSPSHYASYMRVGNLDIVSSSPERFLKCKNGIISSKPIKGTRPRGKTVEDDQRIIEHLKYSEKDRAENLMIVDLVRNDIGKVAEIGSIKVEQLFEIETYDTVHQMLSSVSGKLQKNQSIFTLLRSAFPPGSMTGAPKIRAMEIITEIEKYKRGVYSGCFGYIGLDHYMDLSVVIRTLLIRDKSFEFQVGGAIVSDSDPEEEYQETLNKAVAIMEVLGIKSEDL